MFSLIPTFYSAEKQHVDVFLPVLPENHPVDDFFAFIACQARRTPYNAPPLTRQQRKRSAVSGGENEKKVVDSAGGKRSIRHLATAGCKPVA
ncbi:hypothetical protein RFU35_13005, partial [Dickeya dadantii]